MYVYQGKYGHLNVKSHENWHPFLAFFSMHELKSETSIICNFIIIKDFKLFFEGKTIENKKIYFYLPLFNIYKVNYINV